MAKYLALFLFSVAGACRTHVAHVGESVAFSCRKTSDTAIWRHYKVIEDGYNYMWGYSDTITDSNYDFVNDDLTYNFSITDIRPVNGGLYNCDADLQDCDNHIHLIVLNSTVHPFVVTDGTTLRCPANSSWYYYKNINSKRIRKARAFTANGIYECAENNGLGPRSTLYVVHNTSMFTDTMHVRIFKENETLACAHLRQFKLSNLNECRVGKEISRTGIYRCNSTYYMALFKKKGTHLLTDHRMFRVFD